MIRAIDRTSIHKICSGQVVVDLCSAVKELVENALDAHATCIEVNLKSMGLDSIEVCDNGVGIEPQNYSGIALKHHTSKLQHFEDLDSVKSFGFRGEALNALCELSEKFAVVTKCAIDSVGAELVFSCNGDLISQVPVARATGTSVFVDKLFQKLPVRRGEFERTIKKHFQKTLKILQTYALISVGVKFIVNNFTNGVKQTVFVTQICPHLADNISNIFGAKFLSTLMPFETVVSIGTDMFEGGSTGKEDGAENKDFDGEYSIISSAVSIHNGADKKSVKLDGQNISNTSSSRIATSRGAAASNNCHGESSTSGIGGSGGGTSGSDRCDNGKGDDNSAPQISTAASITNNVTILGDGSANLIVSGCGINNPSLSHQLDGATGSAFISMTGFVSKVGLGVGRSDNDRQYVFCNGRPVDLPKFVKVFNEAWRRFEMKQKPAFILNILLPDGFIDVNLTPDKREVLLQHQDLLLEELRSCIIKIYQPSQYTLFVNGSSIPSYFSKAEPPQSVASAVDTQHVNKFGLNDSVAEVSTTTNHVSLQSAINRQLLFLNNSTTTGISSSPPNASEVTNVNSNQNDRSPAELFEMIDHTSDIAMIGRNKSEIGGSSCALRYASIPTHNRDKSQGTKSPVDKYLEMQSASISNSSNSGTGNSSSSSSSSISRGSSSSSSRIIAAGSVEEIWNVSTDEVIARLHAAAPAAFNAAATVSSIEGGSDACAAAVPAIARAGDVIDAHCAVDGISQPRSSQQREEQERASLVNRSNRVLRQKDFSEMRIIGQFNLGFIIAALGNDLYILDQHACDEKYRFETLQTTTKLHQQPLFAPLTLETSISQELTIASNLDVFEANGFKLKYDEMKPPGSRINILSLPFSKSVHFDARDVNELASMLTEYDGIGSSAASDSVDKSSATNSRGGNKDYLALKNLPLVGANNAVATSSRKRLHSTTADDVEPSPVALGLHPVLKPSEGLKEEVTYHNLPDVVDKVASPHELIQHQPQQLLQPYQQEQEQPVIEDKDEQSKKRNRLSLDASSSSASASSSSKTLARLPKLVAMFASRACRSAVMIGTALATAEMKGIVTRLDSIEQPWNCPHGRPTVRHLVDMRSVAVAEGAFSLSFHSRYCYR